MLYGAGRNRRPGRAFDGGPSRGGARGGRRDRARPDLPLRKRTAQGEHDTGMTRQAATPLPVPPGKADEVRGPRLAILPRHLAPATGWRPPELAVVVPTFNERANVAELVERLDACLAGLAWEVVFVDDDSPDGTAEAVRELARRDPRVRCLERVGRRGLASACVEGMLATAAPLLAVMDADLQHDEALLPAMVERLRESDVDLVV